MDYGMNSFGQLEKKTKKADNIDFLRDSAVFLSSIEDSEDSTLTLMSHGNIFYRKWDIPNFRVRYVYDYLREILGKPEMRETSSIEKPTYYGAKLPFSMPRSIAYSWKIEHSNVPVVEREIRRILSEV